MKVAYILHQFPVLSETFVFDEILWVKKKGVDVCIFSFEKSADQAMHKEAQGLAKGTIYALNPKEGMKPFALALCANLKFFFRSPIRYISYFFKYAGRTGKKKFLQIFYLCGLIEKNMPRHLHAHFATLPATAAMIISGFLNIPFSFTAHAYDIFVGNDFLEEKLKSAKYIVAVSGYNKDYLCRKFPQVSPEKIKVVYCCVDTGMFKPSPRSAGGTLRILSGGRMVEKKGFLYLLRACRLLLDKGLKFECGIFGEGPLKEKLFAEAKKLGLSEAVSFIGAINRSKLLKLLAESDIFVLPSIIADDGDREGVPVVLKEAMSCQKAVISTDTAGIPELIESAKDGMLVPQKDEYALAEAIACLLQDKQLRERLGQKARQKIVEMFNIEKNVAGLIDLFVDKSLI